MSGDFDDLQATLKRSVDDFRPLLDPTALAAAGRRQQQRRHAAAVGLTALGVLAVAAALVLPAMMPAPSVVSATPAPTATMAPTVPPAGPGPINPITTVSTAGWKTFRSKEFPVTFKYPTTWSLDGDGCDSTNCIVFVQPPEDTKAAPIELIRNGFGEADTTGGRYGDTSRFDVLGALPDLAAWDATEGSQQAQALVVRQLAAAAGEIDDYGLAAGTSARDLSPRLSLGESSNWPDHPERVILFSTNTGNLGGTFDEAGRDTVIAILASTRPNADFNPTRGTSDASGGTPVEVYDAMGPPTPGAVTPDGSWKTLAQKEANIAVRYPSDWEVVDARGGIIWIKAPSGYIIDLLTNTSAVRCDAGDMSRAMRLGPAGIQATAKSFGSGPVEIVWRNGGELPVRISLIQRTGVKKCYQQYLNYGGDADVYLGSADNSSNPTQEELDQAFAILASVTRLS